MPASAYSVRRTRLVSAAREAEDKKAELELRAQANKDPLTGLANRRLFELEADHALALAKRRGSTATLIFLDLDDFKSVNDNLGHDAGDALLVHVAERLREETRNSDLVARWGGDEFVMLLHEMTQAECSIAITRYRAALQRPTMSNGRQQSTRGSFGAAFFPSHASDLADLLKEADQAMYQDKVSRRGRGTSPSRRDHAPRPNTPGYDKPARISVRQAGGRRTPL